MIESVAVNNSNTPLELIIIVTNTLGETIEVRLSVICYNVFASEYLSSYNTDVCSVRKIIAFVQICSPEGNSELWLENNSVITLVDVFSLILNAITYMIQLSIYIGFKTTPSDIMPFAETILNMELSDFEYFFRSKVGNPSVNTLLFRRISLFSSQVYPFLKKFINSYITTPNVKSTSNIRTEFGALQLS